MDYGKLHKIRTIGDFNAMTEFRDLRRLIYLLQLFTALKLTVLLFNTILSFNVSTS